MMKGKMTGRGSMEPAGKNRHSTPAGRDFAPGKAVNSRGVGGAVEHLYKEHPHNYNQHGPFHHGKENEVHQPHPYSGKKGAI